MSKESVLQSVSTEDPPPPPPPPPPPQHPKSIRWKLARCIKAVIVEEHLTCPICHDIITDAHVNPECLHRYCGRCIKDSLMHDQQQQQHCECPTCRVHIPTPQALRRDTAFEAMKDAMQEIIEIINEDDTEQDDTQSTSTASDCPPNSISYESLPAVFQQIEEEEEEEESYCRYDTDSMPPWYYNESDDEFFLGSSLSTNTTVDKSKPVHVPSQSTLSSTVDKSKTVPLSKPSQQDHSKKTTVHAPSQQVHSQKTPSPPYHHSPSHSVESLLSSSYHQNLRKDTLNDQRFESSKQKSMHVNTSNSIDKCREGMGQSMLSVPMTRENEQGEEHVKQPSQPMATPGQSRQSHDGGVASQGMLMTPLQSLYHSEQQKRRDPLLSLYNSEQQKQIDRLRHLRQMAFAQSRHTQHMNTLMQSSQLLQRQEKKKEEQKKKNIDVGAASQDTHMAPLLSSYHSEQQKQRDRLKELRQMAFEQSRYTQCMNSSMRPSQPLQYQENKKEEQKNQRDRLKQSLQRMAFYKSLSVDSSSSPLLQHQDKKKEEEKKEEIEVKDPLQHLNPQCQSRQAQFEILLAQNTKAVGCSADRGIGSNMVHSPSSSLKNASSSRISSSNKRPLDADFDPTQSTDVRAMKRVKHVSSQQPPSSNKAIASDTNQQEHLQHKHGSSQQPPSSNKAIASDTNQQEHLQHKHSNEEAESKSSPGDCNDKDLSPRSVIKRPKRTRISKSFEQWYAELIVFKDKFGHCNVSQTNMQYKSLSQWCRYMRQVYKGNEDRRKSLSPAHIKALERIGFQWALRPLLGKRKAAKTFEEHYNDLVEFKKKHGHCKVPRTSEKYKSLGIWCNAIRQTYKGNETRGRPLTASNIRDLERIGFLWKIIKPAKSFNERCEELMEFKVKYGHCNIPQRSDSYQSLRVWCDHMRVVYKSSGKGRQKLAPSTISKLESIGFQWTSNEKN